ncbi:hypothetical protein BJX68DRAFT_226149 [Aspergillus pseudodeflectus]|uniref:Myb-like domain-containing protein n=1 Tax=Aspergillus pseudodeflectus TaxID=176178 RepID=A0ABR4L488_9EURO
MSSGKRPEHLLGWSDEENETLLRLKSQYENWKDIHKLGLFPNRSPAAVQVQYSRLKNGRPRPGVGHVRVRPKPKRPSSTTSTPNITPLKRSAAAATDSPKQPLTSPKPSRKSRRIMDGADHQDQDTNSDSDSDSSEGEDLPWDCNSNTVEPTPSQSQGWFQKPHSHSAGMEHAPATPTTIKPTDTPQTKPTISKPETVGKPETPQANSSSNAALHPPDRFRATLANVVATSKSLAQPTSGNNSPAPPEPIRQGGGFTSVNQASRSPSMAHTPQGSAPPREATRAGSGTPSMPPPTVPAHKDTPPSTPAAQTQGATGASPAPVPSDHTDKSLARPTIPTEKMPTSSVPILSSTHVEKPSQTSTPPVPTPSSSENPLIAPQTTAKPISAPPQTQIAAPTTQTAQVPAQMPSAPEALKLHAVELFNRANEYMSRGIDAVVEEMTRDQRTQIENLTLEAKTLRSCLSEAIAERDSLKRQLEELREDNKGMEEYIQKISDMASRFTRRD